MLLSHLGVPDATFLRLMREELANLSKMFTDETIARNKLKMIGCTIEWNMVEDSNYPVISDPYLRLLLFAHYRFVLAVLLCSFVGLLSDHNSGA